MRRKKYDAPCVQEYHLMEESDLLAGTGGLQPPVLKPGESTDSSGDGFDPNTSKEYTWKDMIDDWEKDRDN